MVKKQEVIVMNGEDSIWQQDDAMRVSLSSQNLCAKKMLLMIIVIGSMFATAIGHAFQIVSPGMDGETCTETLRSGLETINTQHSYFFVWSIPK